LEGTEAKFQQDPYCCGSTSSCYCCRSCSSRCG